MFAVHVEILQAVRANCSSAKKTTTICSDTSQQAFLTFPRFFVPLPGPGAPAAHQARAQDTSGGGKAARHRALGKEGAATVRGGGRTPSKPQPRSGAQLPHPGFQILLCIHTPEPFCVLAAKCCFALGSHWGRKVGQCFGRNLFWLQLIGALEVIYCANFWQLCF